MYIHYYVTNEILTELLLGAHLGSSLYLLIISLTRDYKTAYATNFQSVAKTGQFPQDLLLRVRRVL
jgi:hypothetical protein